MQELELKIQGGGGLMRERGGVIAGFYGICSITLSHQSNNSEILTTVGLL